MKSLALCLLLACAASAGDSGLMIVPESTQVQNNQPAPSAAVSDPEAKADLAVMGTYWNIDEIAGLYKGAAAIADKNPDKFSSRKKAVLLVKYGIAQLIVDPSPAVSAAAQQTFARAEKLDPTLGFAKWGQAAASGCLGHFVDASPQPQFVWGTVADCDRALTHLSAAIRAEPRCGFFYYERSHFTAQKLYTKKGRYYPEGRNDFAAMTAGDCAKAAQQWLGQEWDFPKPSAYCDEGFNATAALKYFLAMIYKHPPKAALEPQFENTSVPSVTPGRVSP